MTIELDHFEKRVFDVLLEFDAVGPELARRVAASIRQAIGEMGERTADEILAEAGHRDAILAALRGET